jgi:hypothetical protein
VGGTVIIQKGGGWKHTFDISEFQKKNICSLGELGVGETVILKHFHRDYDAKMLTGFNILRTRILKAWCKLPVSL